MSLPELIDVQNEFFAVAEVESWNKGGVGVDVVQEAVSHFSVHVNGVNYDPKSRFFYFLFQLLNHVEERLRSFSFLMSQRRK